MENVVPCQSCAYPISKLDEFGSNADGSKSNDYCVYCWVDGAFADWCKDLTVEDMIENNIKHLIEHGYAKTEEDARSQLREFMPTLKRWKSRK
jgi:hypothetical protein